MPLDYRLLDGGALMHVEGTGEITLDDALRLWNRKLTDPAVKPGHDALCDVRGADLVSITAEQLQQLRILMSANVDRAASRVAIVANRDELWSSGKRWEIEADALGRACIVFDNLRPACIWLGLDEAIFAQHQEDESQQETAEGTA